MGHRKTETRQARSYLPLQAEHKSYLADLSATPDLHNPNKISKAFAFYCHKHIIF